MRFSLTRTVTLGLIGVVALLTAGTLLAQDIPLNNWLVPKYQAPSGFHTMADATSPRAFIGLPPCRITDTRGNGAPIQGGIFANSEARNWIVTGICGIPVGADAVSVNFTATGSPAAPPGAFLLAWPLGGAVPPVSILNYQAGQTIANAAIVPLSGGGGMTVNVSHSTHVLMDVNGYFSSTLGTPANFFSLTNNSALYTMRLINSSTTCGSTCGIYQTVNGTGLTYAIEGYSAGSGAGVGVWGDSSGGAGAIGVLGQTYTTALNYGVQGKLSTGNLTACAAGVNGQSGTGSFPCAHFDTAGVLGTSSDLWGVLGISNNVFGRGAQGSRLSAGVIATAGVLGFTGTSGVHSFNDVTAGGAKPFVVPYEGDATKQIVFIATEADEALTSTRGRVSLERGLGTIRVPDHFLKVTAPEGWSVQLTPVGETASLAVLRIDAEQGEIQIKGSRNVDVFYRVEGVRKGYETFKSVQPNVYFVPASAKAQMDPWPEQTKRILVENGIYNADGTVNMETAERLGWTETWAAEREARLKAAAAAESGKKKE